MPCLKSTKINNLSLKKFRLKNCDDYYLFVHTLRYGDFLHHNFVNFLLTHESSTTSPM